MNKIRLEKLIYKNYLKTSVFSILFIELALLIIYFTVNNKIVNISIQSLLSDIEKSVYSTIKNSIKDTEQKFNNIENLSYILQNEHENFFKYVVKLNDFDGKYYRYANNGVFYKYKNIDGASLFVSNKEKIDRSFKEEIFKTEIFDNTLKTLVDRNNLITAAYYNSHRNYIRYYPFLKNAYNVFPSDFEISNYNFYYEANKKNNPEKKAVWTDVYLDPAGQGWMLSVIVPIYNNDFLEGVSGIDITVENIIKNILESEIPYNASSILLDKYGSIIGLTKNSEDTLNLKDSSDYKYFKDEKIGKTIYKRDSFNILNHKDEKIREIFSKVLNEENYSREIYLNNKKYLLFSEKIKKTSWYVVSLINEDNITSEVRSLESYYKNLGYTIIASIIIFYLAFFVFLHFRAKDFVRKINLPLSKIIEMTKNIGNKKSAEKLEECGVYEIDLLNDNFNKMADKLEEKNRELIKSEYKVAFNEKLALTDSLTKVYNRRFLDEFSNKYSNEILSSKEGLSLFVVDIDNFKNINDTYGHDRGDEVITTLVSIVKSVIRKNDFIVRLGGDEFLILLPSSNLKNCKKIAIKLIEKINERNEKLESFEINFTISIGSANYEKDDMGIVDTIKRADKHLYKAKAQGKNCII
ncbi:diguanylate cyclase [Halarcobacter sp.]|uniref:sensor domain-containing diguanylate cyclase n=1 Tax=Halarcobacter sp. TaxID=2321133 RepID=UPI002AAB9B58|nr:diguanylate cyclase [Halarcobacter sp.]